MAVRGGMRHEAETGVLRAGKDTLDVTRDVRHGEHLEFPFRTLTRCLSQHQRGQTGHHRLRIAFFAANIFEYAASSV